MKSKNTKKNSAIKSPFGCDFCGRTFAKESTIDKHLCEYKRRWGDKNLKGNRIGFNAWLNFYAKNTSSKKPKTYLDFTKSSYYLAFVKFGHYCVNTRCVNISRYADWLLKNQIRIDSWRSDKNYTNFLIEYLRQEDPLDAIARSMETLIQISKDEDLESKDAFRFGPPNRICYEVTTGKISPWALYHSESGAGFLGKLDEIQQKMVLEYIDPEKWAIKFKRDLDVVGEVKELMQQAGY
jgi:hypothetical protein